MALPSKTKQTRLRYTDKSPGETSSQFTYRSADRATAPGGTVTTENPTRAGPREDSSFRYSRQKTDGTMQVPDTSAPEPLTRSRAAQYKVEAAGGDAPFRYSSQSTTSARDAPGAAVLETAASNHTDLYTMATGNSDTPFRYAGQSTTSDKYVSEITAPEPMTRQRTNLHAAATQGKAVFSHSSQETKKSYTSQAAASQYGAQEKPLQPQGSTVRRASPYRYADHNAGRPETMAREPLLKSAGLPDRHDAAKMPRDGQGPTQRGAPSQPSHIISSTASAALHRRIDDDQDENVGVQASNELTRAGESALQTGERLYYTRRAKRYHTSANASGQAKGTSNPVSRLWQRRAMRKRYASMYRNRNITTAAAQSQAVLRGADTTRKTGTFVARHRRGVVIGLLAVLLVFVANSVSACTPLIQTVLNSIVIGTYPASEGDVLAAEQAYRAMEISLQDELDHYTEYHPEYDEAVIDQQSIWHDPYVLMALISASIGDSWTAESAQPVLERLFARQYEVSERLETQTRYRTERGPSGAEVEVPYTYTICYVTMVNNDLSHLPFHVLSYDQVCMYALYMATLGNMPDLFAGNPHASKLTEPMEYDVPEELLEADPAFAQLIEEAEKYIGYPYVWGGYNPDTSFDCSGFISYIFTNSGVYDIGRRSATGLHEMCQPITPEEARPGDLIFFKGTMGADVGGVTHVGLYVGNNRMIHCGNPISYADLTDSYWQQHFFSYGRVPY